MKSVELMQARLDESNSKNYQGMALQGVNLQAARFQSRGGYQQQERMISDKRKSLSKALWNSYQGANVINIATGKVARALINPNVVKQDYDDKVISVEFGKGFEVGTVFQWENTNTYWLIYLQDLTELAYFKGDIRKCNYQIEWVNDNGEKFSTYMALRGPKESTINTIIKHGLTIDTPNYTLSFIVPSNEITKTFFNRYQKFYLNEICWEIQAIDNISTPGIIEVNAKEYYANTTEDDIKNGIVGEFITKEIDPNAEDNKIIGNTFIYPKTAEIYKNIDETDYTWSFDQKYPVSLKQINNKEVEIIWDANYSGQFDLHCGPYIKIIIVQSLF